MINKYIHSKRFIVYIMIVLSPILLGIITDETDVKEIELEINEETRKMLASKGFTPKYGARQIARTIRTYLRRPISRLIVGNKLIHGQKLTVSNDEKEELIWEIE